MKLLITIIFSLLFGVGFSQSDTAFWTSSGHLKYTLQKSFDGKTWSNVVIIKAKTIDNSFYYPIDRTTSFYRVVADVSTSNVVLFTTPLPVELTNVNLFNGILQWTSQSEDNNLDYYLIEQGEFNADGSITYKILSKVKPVGNSTYKFKVE